MNKLKTSRSVFTRNALQKAVENENIKLLEKKHKEGYKKKPVDKSEFGIWETEQEWGDWLKEGKSGGLNLKHLIKRDQY